MDKHIRADDLCAYGLNAVGGGYVYGSSGQICTLKFRESCAAANPSQRENILGTSAKWDGKRVWDCSGIFRGAWRELWQYRSGGATTIFRTWCETKDRISAQDVFQAACAEKGLIGTMPDLPGTLVFRGEGTTMQHIGLYVGNGIVVDARGSSQGVLYGTLDSYKVRGELGWTHWGLADDVDYANAIQKPSDIIPLWVGHVKTRTGSGISLWLDNTKKTAASKDKIRDGSLVEILGEMDEKGFAAARYGGKAGVVDLTFIVPQDAEEPAQNTYFATVQGVSKGLNLYTQPVKDAKKYGIMLIKNGGVVEVFPDLRQDGFAFVLYMGHSGYCTESYLRRMSEEVAV
ncbi:NlpC/P60 family protein [Eubacteriales bacterium OttesenSCG-928-A19]|nr:NlpC/P60 family protein [Eubacteriales bacterium OttesenSCG-928-A19]